MSATTATASPPRRGFDYEARAQTPGRPRARRGLVRALKVAMPTLAFGLVGLAVAWPSLEGDDGFSINLPEIGPVSDDLSMINPRYSGFDDKGRPFEVTAASAVQDAANPSVIELQTLAAKMRLKPDESAALTAERGVYRPNEERLELEGDVRATSDAGYVFYADAVTADLASRHVVSELPVRGDGPMGDLSAERMEAFDGGARVRFEGQVRVTIFPKGAPRDGASEAEQ